MPERLAASGIAEVLDALPAEVTVIDRSGFIVYVNKSWVEFAVGEAGTQNEIDPIGKNYLEVCDADPAAAPFGAGIRAVLAGERESFLTRYPCHSPEEYRIFLLQATAISSPIDGAVISHIRLPDPEVVDLSFHEEVPRADGLPFSKKLAGVTSMADADPVAFQDMIDQYALIIDEAVNTALLNKPRVISERLRELGRQLVRARASAKDAIQLHVAALKQQVAQRPGRAAGYTEEARYLLIELLGTMVLRYRMQLIGHRSPDPLDSDQA